MRTVMLSMTDEEAHALASVIREIAPEHHGVDPQMWYAASDKLSSQLPDTFR